MTPDASARGRANRAKGQTAERDVAKYLRPWFPDARRAVFNGWTSKNQHADDPGDIEGTSPGLWWSVKSTQVERIEAWMNEIEVKAPSRIGLLVVKRRGCADPGRWGCWIRHDDLTELYGCPFPHTWGGSGHAPVRFELQEMLWLLIHANYARTPDAPVDPMVGEIPGQVNMLDLLDDEEAS